MLRSKFSAERGVRPMRYRPLKLGLIIYVLILLASCTSMQVEDDFTDIRFMFDENEVKNFDYPFEDNAREITELLIKYSESEKKGLVGVSRFILGRHPTMYVLYFEDRAVVNFFYWGSNVGKGYIEYSQGASEQMALEFEHRGLCGGFEEEESIWGFHVSKNKIGKWIICNEPFNIPILGSDKDLEISETPFIGEYFDESFGKSIVWNHYTYGD